MSRSRSALVLRRRSVVRSEATRRFAEASEGAKPPCGGAGVRAGVGGQRGTKKTLARLAEKGGCEARAGPSGGAREGRRTARNLAKTFDAYCSTVSRGSSSDIGGVGPRGGAVCGGGPRGGAGFVSSERRVLVELPRPETGTK